MCPKVLRKYIYNLIFPLKNGRVLSQENKSENELWFDFHPANKQVLQRNLFPYHENWFWSKTVFLRDEVRIKAHFLICFLALVIYRYLEKELDYSYTCETILTKLKSMNFADIQEQGFIPLYTRNKLTDALHKIFSFDTDFEFITKSQMKTIQKKSKGRE